jgi:hypothetical protein
MIDRGAGGQVEQPEPVGGYGQQVGYGKQLGPGMQVEYVKALGAPEVDDRTATVIAALTTRIDEGLRQFTARDLVAAAEVVDLLLDLRLVLLAAEQEPAHSH